jgi:hypothetical protein
MNDPTTTTTTTTTKNDPSSSLQLTFDLPQLPAQQQRMLLPTPPTAWNPAAASTVASAPTRAADWQLLPFQIRPLYDTNNNNNNNNDKVVTEKPPLCLSIRPRQQQHSYQPNSPTAQRSSQKTISSIGMPLLPDEDDIHNPPPSLLLFSKIHLFPKPRLLDHHNEDNIFEYASAENGRTTTTTTTTVSKHSPRSYPAVHTTNATPMGRYSHAIHTATSTMTHKNKKLKNHHHHHATSTRDTVLLVPDNQKKAGWCDREDDTDDDTNTKAAYYYHLDHHKDPKTSIIVPSTTTTIATKYSPKIPTNRQKLQPPPLLPVVPLQDQPEDFQAVPVLQPQRRRHDRNPFFL